MVLLTGREDYNKNIMKLKIVLLLLMISFLCSSSKIHAQSSTIATGIRPTIKKLANGIAKDNILKSEGVGFSGTRTDQWERFENLKKCATDSELLTLSSDTNGVVRCYAFQALANRKEVDVFPILLKHLYDTTSIETIQGCIVNWQTVGDYLLEVVTPEYIDPNDYKLTSTQRATVDSILIFDKRIKISAREELLSNLKPDFKYYERIKEIATTENSPIAVLAIARYKNKSDIDIIKKLFENEKMEYYAIYSAREFPDSSFYSYLINIFDKEWKDKLYDYPKWRILYQALAKYPSNHTYQLFERTTQTKDDFRYQTLCTYLLIAITKYPDSLYESLKGMIKLDEYHSHEVDDQIDAEK